MPKVDPNDPAFDRIEEWEEAYLYGETYWHDKNEEIPQSQSEKDDIEITKSIIEHLINNNVHPSGVRDNVIVVCGSLALIIEGLEIVVSETVPNPDAKAYRKWKQKEIDRIEVADPDSYDKILSYARQHKEK